MVRDRLGPAEHFGVVPELAEDRAVLVELLDQLLEGRIVGRLAVVDAELRQHAPRHRLISGRVALIALVLDQQDPEQVALLGRELLVVAEHLRRELVPADDVPARSHHERRHAERLDHPQERRAHLGHARRRRRSRPVLHEREQVFALVGRHPQRRADALENVGGHLDLAALLEPGVPGHADAGERRDVLAAQARSPAAVGVRKTDLGGRQARAAAFEEVDELSTLSFHSEAGSRCVRLDEACAFFAAPRRLTIVWRLIVHQLTRGAARRTERFGIVRVLRRTSVCVCKSPALPAAGSTPTRSTHRPLPERKLRAGPIAGAFNSCLSILSAFRPRYCAASRSKVTQSPRRFRRASSPSSWRAATCSRAPRRAPARRPASLCRCCSGLSASAPSEGRRRIRALILTPTRELAAQVEDSVRRYGKYVPLRSAVVFGGVSINPQISLLRRGVDVLVATPGRLLDHASQAQRRSARRRDLRARRGGPDARHGLPARHPPRHRIAAGEAPEPTLLRHVPRRHPRRSRASCSTIRRASRSTPPNATAERIEQLVYHVEKSSKRARTLALDLQGRLAPGARVHPHEARREPPRRASSTATGSLRRRSTATRARRARTRALADFKAGRVRVLVATDIAARGLDIDQLPHVVNYELARSAGVLRASHRPHGSRGSRRRRRIARGERRAPAAEGESSGSSVNGSGVEATPDAPPRPDAGRPHGSPGRRSEAGRHGHDGPRDGRQTDRPRRGDAGRRDYVNNERQAPYADRGGRAPAPNTEHGRRDRPVGHGQAGTQASQPQHGRPRGNSRAARRRAGRAARQQ